MSQEHLSGAVGGKSELDAGKLFGNTITGHAADGPIARPVSARISFTAACILAAPNRGMALRTSAHMNPNTYRMTTSSPDYS